MELRDELLDSLILDNTYIKLEDLDKKDKLEKIIPIVKDMKIVGECRYHVVDVYKHSLYSLKELEEDIMPIDDLIGFAMSDAGKACFGEKMAQDISTHAQEIKAKGALYCDCPACQAAEAILKKKDLLLK